MDESRRLTYNGEQIRAVWIKETGSWLFSVVDVVSVLCDTKSPRRYWSDLKRALTRKDEAALNGMVRPIRLVAKDGKTYPTDVAAAEHLCSMLSRAHAPQLQSFCRWAAELQPPTSAEMADPMPLLSGAFVPGEVQAFIASLPDEELRTIAQAEYCYYSAQPAEVVRISTPFLDHPSLSVRLSAALVNAYANLSRRRTDLARIALKHLEDDMRCLLFQTTKDVDADAALLALPGGQLPVNASPRECAMAVFVANTAFILLHKPMDILPPVEKFVHLLEGGARYFSCYLMAHKAYLENDYGRAVGLAEAALMLGDKVYPVPWIYLHLIAAVAWINLREQDKAKAHFMKAWKIAHKDRIFQPFAEHHGLLQGMVEVCLKHEYPQEFKEIIETVYSFSAGWRSLHNRDTGDEISLKLTTTEYALAMLASRGWSNTEISTYMGLSENTVRNYLSNIYAKLGITKRSELAQFTHR